jgi:hypothetical protein
MWRQTKPLQPKIFKILSNITLQPTLRTSIRASSFMYPGQNSVCISPPNGVPSMNRLCLMTCHVWNQTGSSTVHVIQFLNLTLSLLLNVTGTSWRHDITIPPPFCRLFYNAARGRRGILSALSVEVIPIYRLPHKEFRKVLQPSSAMYKRAGTTTGYSMLRGYSRTPDSKRLFLPKHRWIANSTGGAVLQWPLL